MEALQTRDFGSKVYKRSRKAYAMECTFEYFVSLLVTEAFLAKVLTSIGVSDGMIQIISTLIALSQLFQFFSIFVVQKITNTKRFVVLFHTIGQLLFMALSSRSYPLQRSIRRRLPLRVFRSRILETISLPILFITGVTLT